jgi:hypothetical protein
VGKRARSRQIVDSSATGRTSAEKRDGRHLVSLLRRRLTHNPCNLTLARRSESLEAVDGRPSRFIHLHPKQLDYPGAVFRSLFLGSVKTPMIHSTEAFHTAWLREAKHASYLGSLGRLSVRSRERKRRTSILGECVTRIPGLAPEDFRPAFKERLISSQH